MTESLFSVDGDCAPIAELHDVCRAEGAVLLIDEAHAVGAVGPGGRGGAVAEGLGAGADVVRTMTLSKALGSQGGAILASRAVIEHIVDTARAVIFDAALAPPSAAAATAALAHLAARPGPAAAARTHAQTLAGSARRPGSFSRLRLTARADLMPDDLARVASASAAS